MTEEQQQRESKLIEAIQRTFSSADGQQTLAWLERISGYSASQPPGPEHSMAYYLGGRQIYVLILQQLARNPKDIKQGRAQMTQPQDKEAHYG